MKQVTIASIIFATAVLAGLSAEASSDVEKQRIPVELLQSARAKVSSYSLRHEDGKLIVAGRVTSLNPIRIPGHVDLVVCGPDGQAAGYYQAPIYDYASKRGGLKSARFSASITPVPSDDSTIRLKYDAPPTGEEHLLSCKK